MLLEFQRDFVATIDAPAHGPMRVYRNTVLSGSIEALRANYPTIARLLGEEMFDCVAADYWAECPPRSPVLAHYGERLSDWLRRQSWISEFPYLADVARIDWHYIEALFSSDAQALVMGELHGLSEWQVLKLALHPATRFDWLKTPAMSIWAAQREELQGELEFDWVAEGVLITRPHLEVHATRLDREAHHFLSCISLDASVGDAALATASLYPETDMGSLFTSLVNLGAFATFDRSLP